MHVNYCVRYMDLLQSISVPTAVADPGDGLNKLTRVSICFVVVLKPLPAVRTSSSRVLMWATLAVSDVRSITHTTVVTHAILLLVRRWRLYPLAPIKLQSQPGSLVLGAASVNKLAWSPSCRMHRHFDVQTAQMRLEPC